MFDKLKVFTGNSNPQLAEEICQYLHLPVSEAAVRRFSDGEIFVEVRENVRGADVFVVQSTSPPVNDHLMELLIMVDAFRRASARRITAVIPYYGYARQDRKARGREPISAKLVANLITTAGADRVLTLDLHTDQIQGFFDIPVDHLTARGIIAEHFRRLGFTGESTIVVAPDVGGVNQARLLADHLDASLGIVAKRRPKPGEAQILEVIGDFRGRRAIVYDDMIDTGGTVIQAAEALLERGAEEVHCAVTHAVLSENALERLANSPFASIVVTDTIPLPPDQPVPEKLTVLTVAPLLADAIKRIHYHQSVSACLLNSHYRQPRLL